MSLIKVYSAAERVIIHHREKVLSDEEKYI